MNAQVEFPPSLWAATAPARDIAPPLNGAAETDVAVIGGGFTGLSAALHLAREGRAVTVLEGKAVGWGASGRNNGQVIPTLTAAEPDALVARHGAAGDRFARLVGGSASILFDIIRAEGIEAEAEQTGWFQPAHSPGRIRLSRARVEAWRRFGFPAEFKDAAETAEILGSDFWHGGMYNPTGGHINPLALARGMVGAAERPGAVIHETSPAIGYVHDGTAWIVTSDTGTLKARALILATNTYTGELKPGLAPRLAKSVIPVLSWQMATEPVGDNLRRKILPGRQAVSDTRGDLRFFRYDALNRLVTGGAVIGARNVAERVQAKAARNLAEAFPELGEPKTDYVWSGYVGMNWDRFPRVHHIGADGWTWIGCYGRGVALGVALGREMARAASGVRRINWRCRSRRFAVSDAVGAAPRGADISCLAAPQGSDGAEMKEGPDMNDMPILLRRRIEATILKHVLDVITERSGREEAEAVIGETCSRSAIEQGKSLAEDLGHAPDLEDFATIMPNWTREDALRFDPIEMSAEKMDFNVIRCRYAEMYREMGLSDIGHLLSCNRDGGFCIGYNPEIELTRTQTIMKGASHCDFRYRMKKEA